MAVPHHRCPGQGTVMEVVVFLAALYLLVALAVAAYIDLTR